MELVLSLHSKLYLLPATAAWVSSQLNGLFSKPYFLPQQPGFSLEHFSYVCVLVPLLFSDTLIGVMSLILRSFINCYYIFEPHNGSSALLNWKSCCYWILCQNSHCMSEPEICSSPCFLSSHVLRIWNGILSVLLPRPWFYFCISIFTDIFHLNFVTILTALSSPFLPRSCIMLFQSNNYSLTAYIK